jgi:tetratricopeptide (TPR) repeat protein
VLAAAHRESLVHRDLKPGNLMLCPDGTVRVLDFGLAVALASADSQITRTGQALGTPAYMAPELVMAGMTGPQTDLYAVGCTLFEMVTGRTLFGGATAYAVMKKHVDERAPALRSVRQEAPGELDGLVLELLAKKPEERPSSAGEVYERLLPFVRDLGMLAGVLTPPTVPSPVRMYASVAGRVLAEAAPAIAVVAPPIADVEGPRIRRSEIARAREEAKGLVAQSRYSQAAEVLAATAAPATRALGSADPEVVSLRFELANVRFDGGDYRGAAPIYRDLIGDLADLAEDDELALRCRVQEATCNALIGQTSLALEQLKSLLELENRLYGEDDDRVLDLRKQVGLLQLGGGHQAEAMTTLTALLTDIEQLHGSEHPTASHLRGLLDGLHGR